MVSEERLFAQNLCDSGVSTTVLIEDGGKGGMNLLPFWLCFETKQQIENVAEVTQGVLP